MNIWLLIIIVGISTFFMRAIFLFFDHQILSSPKFREGLDSVPVTMLVVLVVPLTLFVSNTLSLIRIEVISIISAIPVVFKTRKPELGLIVAMGVYLLLFYTL